MIFLLESRSTTARFEGGSAPPSFTRDRVALQCDNNARAEMRSYYGSFPPGDFVHKSVKVCQCCHHSFGGGVVPIHVSI